MAIIDYVDVALIKKCYFELAVQVANFKKYQRPLLNHLCYYKSQHWDATIREMTAISFENLVHFDVDYVKNEVLKFIIFLIF